MSEAYVHQVGEQFKALPEVYQVELTNACSLKCPMCLRSTEMVRPDNLLKMDLLKLMHKRGDFGGSYYVELQMAGEPTLHPQLTEIILYMKQEVKVLVGLSTHGHSMRKPGVVDALLRLDALTISVDSVDPLIYSKMRYPMKLEQLYAQLDLFFALLETNKAHGEKVPFIELQLVITDLVSGTGDVPALAAVMKGRGWDRYASIRTTGDCFYEMDGRKPAGSMPRNMSLCMNPFASVSVAQNGDVVSCCYVFEPKRAEVNYYGNLYRQSLAEIWNGPKVKEMQRLHMAGEMKDQCAKCYLKSPMQIHAQIVSRLVRIGG